MTKQRDLKRRIRERQAKTGEAYTTARLHLLGQGANGLGEPSAGRPTEAPQRVEAAVLKVGETTVRVRILGETDQVTVRISSYDAWKIVPGHIATILVGKRWSWRGDAYASGNIQGARVDIAKLGLDPLPLCGGDLDDVADWSEPYDDDDDPYTPLWKKFTAKPRPSFEFDPIAWGSLPGMDEEENPTCDAAELAKAGDYEAANDMLMDLLCKDLRCIDAHAHLGNWAFDSSPDKAIVHYEVGIGIGELSLRPGFDGLLLWGAIYNRPFLRCLHGYGLCLWRLGRVEEARQVFERILSLNPIDNQGVRACWGDVCKARTWVEMHRREEQAERGGGLH